MYMCTCISEKGRLPCFPIRGYKLPKKQLQSSVQDGKQLENARLDAVLRFILFLRQPRAGPRVVVPRYIV